MRCAGCPHCGDNNRCELQCASHSDCLDGTQCKEGFCISLSGSNSRIGAPCEENCDYCLTTLGTSYEAIDICTEFCEERTDCPSGFSCRLLSAEGLRVCAPTSSMQANPPISTAATTLTKIFPWWYKLTMGCATVPTCAVFGMKARALTVFIAPMPNETVLNPMACIAQNTSAMKPKHAPKTRTPPPCAFPKPPLEASAPYKTIVL